MKKIVNIVISVLLIIAGATGLSSAAQASLSLGIVWRGLDGAPPGTIRLEKILDLRDSEMHQTTGGWKYVDGKTGVAGAAVPAAPYGQVVDLPGSFTIKWSGVGYDADGDDIDVYLTAADMKGTWIASDNPVDTRPARLNNDYRALVEWSAIDGNGNSSDYYRNKVLQGLSSSGVGTYGGDKLTTRPYEVGITDIGNGWNDIKNFTVSTKFTVAFKKAGTQTSASGTYVMHVDDIDQPDSGLYHSGANNYDTSTLNPLRAEHFYMGSGIYDVWIDNYSTLQDVTHHPRWVEFGNNHKFIGGLQVNDTTASLRFIADPTFSFRAGGNGGNELFGNIFAPPREIPVAEPVIKRSSECGEVDELVLPKSKYYEMYKSDERKFDDYTEVTVNVKPLNGAVLTNMYEYPKTIRLNVQPPCKESLDLTFAPYGKIWANFGEPYSFGDGDAEINNVTVGLYDSSDKLLGTATTNIRGMYSFKSVNVPSHRDTLYVRPVINDNSVVNGSRLGDKSAYASWSPVHTTSSPSHGEALSYSGKGFAVTPSAYIDEDCVYELHDVEGECLKHSLAENINFAVNVVPVDTPKSRFPNGVSVSGNVWANLDDKENLNAGEDARLDVPVSLYANGQRLESTTTRNGSYEFNYVPVPEGVTELEVRADITDGTLVNGSRLGDKDKFASWGNAGSVNVPTVNAPMKVTSSNSISFKLIDGVDEYYNVNRAVSIVKFTPPKTVTVSGNVWANFDDVDSFGEGDKSVVGAVVTLKRHKQPTGWSPDPITTKAGSATIDESGSYKFENVEFDDNTLAFSVEIQYSDSNTVDGSRLDDNNVYERWYAVGSVDEPTVNEPLNITGHSILYKIDVAGVKDNVVVENVNSAINIAKATKPYRLIVDGTVWYDTPGSVAGSYDTSDTLLSRVHVILRDDRGNELKLNDWLLHMTSEGIYETPVSQMKMGNYQLGVQPTESWSEPIFAGIELPKGTTLDSEFTLEFVIDDNTQIDGFDESTRLGNTDKFSSWSVLDGVNKPAENQPLTLKNNVFKFKLSDAVKFGGDDSRVYRLANANAAVKTESLADVTVNKVSPDGGALTGAVFTVSNNNGFNQELDMSQVSSAVMSLPNGTYYLTETTAPDGFALLPDTIEFTVADGKVTVAESLVANKAVKVDGLSMAVTNFKPGELPRSGGSLPFILAGAFAVLAAGGYLVYRKRDM